MLDSFFDWIYPRKCIFCNELLDFGSGSFICSECGQSLDGLMIHPPCCEICGSPLPTEGGSCPDCSEALFSFERNFSCFIYHDKIRDMIRGFKYKNKPGYAKSIASVLYRHFCDLPEFDGFVPVPLHNSRLKLRGYNQSALLAEQLGKLYKKPVFYYLARTRKTLPQNGLTAVERASNIAGAFALAGGVSCAGSTLFLVDDIFTTGGTLDACAKVLVEGGANKIYTMTIAKPEYRGSDRITE